jgi:hypothetical protein
MIYVIAISLIDALEKIQLNQITYVKEFAFNNLKKEIASATRVGIVSRLKVFEITIKEISSEEY